MPLMPSLITAALTALFGVFVFVTGQLVQRFFLDPIQEQRKIIGEISFSLLFHANVMDESARGNEGLLRLEDPKEVAKRLRSLGSRLRATLWAIPFYKFFAFLRVVPTEDSVMTASQSLVGWSNSIHRGDPTRHRKIIAEKLKLKG